jgi:hypothetical protein
MRVTFDQAIELSATEFYLLRRRAEVPEAFTCAMEAMRVGGYVADTVKGTVCNRDGVVSLFDPYDWGETYDDMPHHVFYDFFRGLLLNKYSRILRGMEP